MKANYKLAGKDEIMQNKTSKLVMAIFGYIGAALIPTILMLIYWMFLYRAFVVLALYLPAVVIIILFAWKSPKGLYAVSAGFFISLIAPMVLASLGGKYWPMFSFFGSALGVGETAVILVFAYAAPFAIMSFLIALIRIAIIMGNEIPPKTDEPETKQDDDEGK